MQCFICGEQMRVVMVEPHVVDMQGFELRTFQCIGCGDTEKRPVFDSTRSLRPPALVSEAIAAAACERAGPEQQGPKPFSASLVRLRGGTPQSLRVGARAASQALASNQMAPRRPKCRRLPTSAASAGRP